MSSHYNKGYIVCRFCGKIFRIFEKKYFCFFVAMFSLVQDVEAIFHLAFKTANSILFFSEI